MNLSAISEIIIEIRILYLLIDFIVGIFVVNLGCFDILLHYHVLLQLESKPLRLLLSHREWLLDYWVSHWWTPILWAIHTCWRWLYGCCCITGKNCWIIWWCRGVFIKWRKVIVITLFHLYIIILQILWLT